MLYVVFFCVCENRWHLHWILNTERNSNHICRSQMKIYIFWAFSFSVTVQLFHMACFVVVGYSVFVFYSGSYFVVAVVVIMQCTARSEHIRTEYCAPRWLCAHDSSLQSSFDTNMTATFAFQIIIRYWPRCMPDLATILHAIDFQSTEIRPKRKFL